MLSFSQYAAVAVGAFYVFAGFIVLRAMVLDRLMDKLLAALSNPSDPKELWRSRVLTAGGVLTLAGGVTLMMLSPLAVALFVFNALWQGGYLLWAERALPPADDGEARGRQQTKNAFVVYAAATAFVVWLAAVGQLRPWEASLQVYAIDALAVLAAIAGVWLFLNRRQSANASGETERDDNPPDVNFPAEAQVTRVKFAPSYGASPLTNADTGEPVSPAWLEGIEFELADRIDRWDDSWQATFNADDPASSGFEGAAAHAAYIAEGREIVAALRAQWQGELVEVAEEFR